jgi:GNAT superfamily N-acetyltransferase
LCGELVYEKKSGNGALRKHEPMSEHQSCMNQQQTSICEETIYYLEITSLAELRPARLATVQYELRRAEIPCPELSRFFYTAIGGDWRWVDSLGRDYAQWLAYVTRPGYEMWIAYVGGTPAAYFELDGEPGGDTELVFLGVLPQFAGRGLGGALLTRAVERAWVGQSRRVWLHTCSFDHPVALQNYLARGFRIYRTDTHPKEMPREPLGPWPGANKTPEMTAQLARMENDHLSPDRKPAKP